MLLRLLISFTFLLLFVGNTFAQQGRGLFLSTFGVDAPSSYGDFDNFQAVYFDIPRAEPRPVYLRLFDPEVGGAYDERHGTFDTRTMFIVLGGVSAAQVYGISDRNQYQEIPENASDLIAKQTFSAKGPGDASWYTLTELPLDKGFDLGNGFVRFVMIAKGLRGDDGNFFDLALSYSRTEKMPPPNAKTFVYSLSLRIPSLLLYDWTDFQGQIKIPTNGNELFYIRSFDMDGVPMSVSIPFQDDISLLTSNDGEWIENELLIPNYKSVEWFGVNFFGRRFNNTFGLAVSDENGNPVPVPLPILDYEAPVYPTFSYKTSFDPEDCFKVSFSTEITNKDLVKETETLWIVNADTIRDEQFSLTFDSLGYYPFSLDLSATVAGVRQDFSFYDSVLITRPPRAWGGGNRANVPDNYLAFDATASYSENSKIVRYEWDFGDGTKGTGARVDKKYKEPGEYKVILTVFDETGSECGKAESEAIVKINRPPIPKIIAPNWVQIGEEFTLDGTGSTDPDGFITDYLWQIGNDTLMEGPIVNYALLEDKSTKVTLQITDDARTFNSTQRENFTIKVNKKPWASAGKDKVISPNRPATFDAGLSRDPDGEIVNYEWFFPNGVTQSGKVVKQAIEEPGIYQVYLKVTDNTLKAFAYDSLVVVVNHPPVPVIRGEKVFNTGRVSLDATESYDPDGRIIEQYWTVNGRKIKGEVLNYAFEKPGSYTVQHTLVDNSGTYSSAQTIDYPILINDLPKPVFEMTAWAAPIDTVLMNAGKSTDSDGEIVSYKWDFGDGESAEGKVVEHQYFFPGTYQVSLTVQDDAGGEGSSVILVKEIKINSAPFIDYTFPKRIMPNKEVTLDMSKSFDIDGRIIAYEVMIDSVWQRFKKPVIKLKIPETETDLRIAVIDDSGLRNSRSETKIPIRLNEQPIALGNGPIRTATPLVILDGTKSYDPDGDELLYYWDFGDGKSTKGAMVLHKYPRGGSYKAILTVDDQRGLDNSFAYDTVEVFINRPPEPYFELPFAVCVGDTVTYDGTGSYEPDGNLLRYEWIFGDGKSAQGGKGKHVFEQEGRYQVILTLDDNEGMPNSTASFSQIIDVVGAPEAYAGEDFTACELELIQFDGSGSKAADESQNEYTWDFGDGDTGDGIYPVHSYRKPGKYKVTLTIKSDIPGSCQNSSSDVVWVTVMPRPVAKFELPTVIRSGEMVSLDPTPSLVEGQKIKTITWQIGEDETVIYSRVSSNENGFSRSDWRISSTKSVSLDAEPDRSALGILPKLERLLPDGEYQITLLIETESVASCNTAQQVNYVTVKDKPQLVVNDVPVLVPGIPFQFSAAEISSGYNDIKSAYWNFGDGTTKQGLFVSHTYAKAGDYKLEFIADDGSGGASAITKIEKMVKVNAQPKAAFSGPGRALPTDVLTFDASESYDEDGSIVQYNWFFSDGFRAQGAKVSHTFNRAGNFMVTLSVVDDANTSNSVNSISKTVNVADVHDLTLSMPNIICPGTNINIVSALSVPTNDTTQVQIFVGNKKISYKEAQSLRFTFSGVYNLRVILANLGSDGTSVIRHTLVVNGPPEIYANVPEVVTIGAANEFATFDASNSFDPNNDLVRIAWDFGDGETAFGKKVQHQYKRPGTYQVKLTITDDKQMDCSTAENSYTVKVIRQ